MILCAICMQNVSMPLEVTYANVIGVLQEMELIAKVGDF